MMNNQAIEKRRVGIYIHVPFCRSKCYYCDFCSQTRASDERIEAYVNSLCREIVGTAEKLREGGHFVEADTVYFGGGTPSLLPPLAFERILRVIREQFGICEDAEITAEANPKTACFERLSAMRRAGINRLSIGMQSVHDNELRALGRAHDFAAFESIYRDAREAGFDNISVDLMYGIPEQTKESFIESVQRLAALGPEHISSYCLTVEEGTSFGRRRDTLCLPDEDTVADMYADMSRVLANLGYKKYEISNFAHNGRESRHNNKYWRLEDYLGFGPAAHGCFMGVRYAHSRDVEAYIAGESIYCDVQKIEHDESMNEYVMLGMRLADGVSVKDFEQRFSADFYESFGKKLAKFAPEYVTIDGEKCAFTDKGMFVSSYILSEVLDF